MCQKQEKDGCPVTGKELEADGFGFRVIGGEDDGKYLME
jgi:hypothetical protein